MSKKKNKRLYIDLETTGSERLIHGVHQISGIIEIDNKVVTEFDFKCRPFEGQHIDDEVLEKCNVTREQIMEYPAPVDTFEKMNNLLMAYSEKFYPYTKFTIAGYSAGFDVDFLQKFYLNNDNTDFGLLQDWQYVDVLALVRLLVDWGDKGLARLGNHRLGTLCDFFGISLEKEHDSMHDIRATRILHKRLTLRLVKLIRGEHVDK